MSKSQRTTQSKRRSPTGRFVKKEGGVLSQYGNMFTSKGKGKKMFNGIGVRKFLKKVLGNRVFDVYLKYTGIKTLTTATLIPFGLILTQQYLDKMFNKKKGGGVIPKKIPVLDNPLVGSYLKLAGLSALDLTASTLLPLGVAMIIYDLSIRNLKKQVGGRLSIGSSTPVNIIQKLDSLLSGQDGASLQEAYDLPLNCANGACQKAGISSEIEVSGPAPEYVDGLLASGDNTGTMELTAPLQLEKANPATGWKPADPTNNLMAGGGDIGCAAQNISEVLPGYEPVHAEIPPGEVIPQGAEQQVGGAAYNKITNPATGRKVSIYGRTGRNIVKNYLNYLNGGN